MSTDQVIAAVEARHDGAVPAGTRDVIASGGLPLKLLDMRHPDYRGDHWQVLHALYKGGPELFDNMKVIKRVFPRHRNEHEVVYRERIARAFYTPYAGEIVDYLVAQLFAQPLIMRLAGGAETPQFYSDLQADLSPRGGKRQSLAQLLRSVITSALVKRWCWTLVDLPPAEIYESRLEEERAGRLDPYMVHLEPECVIDWDADEDGALSWAVVYTEDRRRRTIQEARDWITRRWTVYTAGAWSQYMLRHRVDDTPPDETVVPLLAEGTQTFGRVPLQRFEVPDGLWVMAKIEGLAREHFNKRSALGWAETQALLPELYEFLGPEQTKGAIVGTNQKDPGRAVTQPRGQGYVQVRGSGDKAEFIGPSAEPFKCAAESCKSLRDEMHRVTHLMALTVENNAAALRRSGESKSEDRASTAVVLGAFGDLVREHAEAIFGLASAGRGEADLVWQAEGMDSFDTVATGTAVEEALIVDQLRIESPTFRRLHRFHLCKLILGDVATAEEMESIRTELEQNIASEVFAPMKLAAQDDEGEDDEDEEGSEDDGDDDPPPRRTLIAAGRR